MDKKRSIFNNFAPPCQDELFAHTYYDSKSYSGMIEQVALSVRTEEQTMLSMQDQ